MSENQIQVPAQFRKIVESIVNCISRKDLHELNSIIYVENLEEKNFKDMLASVEAYGDNLVPLSPECWETSVCLRTGRGLECLVDLSTEKQPVSDLALKFVTSEEVVPHCIELKGLYVP